MAPKVLVPGLDGLVAHFGLSLVDEDGNKVTTTPEPKKSEETKVPAGSLSSSVPLYQGEPDKFGRTQWVAKEPEDVQEAAENEGTLGHAIIVRNVKSQDSRKKFQIHSLIIQSPHLKEALATIFDGYPGVACNLRRLVFKAPFQPFVHRWAQLQEYIQKDHKEELMRDHLKLLHDILVAELGETLKAIEDYVKHGVVTFEHVWTLFAPRTTIISSSQFGDTIASEVVNGTMAENNCGKFFLANSSAIGVDGECFGWSHLQLRIPEFEGVRPVRSLQFYPISFSPVRDEVTNALIKRGRKFEQLAGYHYMTYTDHAIETVESPQGGSKDKIIQHAGRVVIDAGAYDHHNGQFVESIAPLPKSLCATGTDDQIRMGESSDDDDSYDHVSGDKTPSEEPETKFPTLSDDQRLLCLNLVRGYSLKLKKWLKFKVDSVKPIVWSDNAFSSLVLPPEQKELVLALSQTQLAATTQPFDDVIQGKGRGMILLLTGPPGVGKTLTAESTAESMRTPLFMMGAGDLGTQAHEVESKLDSILNLAAKWKAILLIDECDVFLEARSIHDLERNKLVSIFLRLLEYYEGILFLTTNRVANMDDAFQSRIHLTIAYDDLTVESRTTIWKTFIRDMKYETSFSDEDMRSLAELELNGRQIKNVVKSSQLLAFSKGAALAKAHVDVILKIQKTKEARL